MLWDGCTYNRGRKDSVMLEIYDKEVYAVVGGVWVDATAVAKVDVVTEATADDVEVSVNWSCAAGT